jgi:hypothetical protein
MVSDSVARANLSSLMCIADWSSVAAAFPTAGHLFEKSPAHAEFLLAGVGTIANSFAVVMTFLCRLGCQVVTNSAPSWMTYHCAP